MNKDLSFLYGRNENIFLSIFWLTISKFSHVCTGRNEIKIRICRYDLFILKFYAINRNIDKFLYFLVD